MLLENNAFQFVFLTSKFLGFQGAIFDSQLFCLREVNIHGYLEKNN